MSPSPKLDFDHVFADSAQFVWRLLRRLGVATDDVGDVSQEVFIVVYRRQGDYDGRPARAWIYGICLRAAADYRKRAYRRRERVGDPDFEPSVPAGQYGSMVARRARERLEQVLAELSDEARAVFVLYELEELAMSEIASILQCPLQTAYSRLRAARQAVRAGFAPQSPEGAGK